MVSASQVTREYRGGGITRPRSKTAGEHDAGLSNGTRTAGELRSRARAIRLARDHVKAEKAAVERRRQAEEAEKAPCPDRRGESIWQEVEAEIERRNAPGYDKAASLLLDLHTIAETRGTLAEFGRRLQDIRKRHARKERFIERRPGDGTRLDFGQAAGSELKMLRAGVPIGAGSNPSTISILHVISDSCAAQGRVTHRRRSIASDYHPSRRRRRPRPLLPSKARYSSLPALHCARW